MSKLIHGTSLYKALMIIENPVNNAQNQEKLYFFESERKEAYMGALSFSTGNGLRSINNELNFNFLNDYIALNNNFPKGIFGRLLKSLLNSAISQWKGKQKKLKIHELDSVAAIIECERIDELISVNRKNIVFESFIEKDHFHKIKVSTIYVDSIHREYVQIFLKDIAFDVEIKNIEDLFSISYEKHQKNKITL